MGESNNRQESYADRGARAIGLSVIVSSSNSEVTLQQTLIAIRASLLSRDSYELIVVDDSSSDASVAVAARFADKVVRLSGRPAGPAYARNRGFEVSRGELIAFIDADVVVRTDTLPRMLATLRDRPEIDAISASLDESSGASNFVSQYWNLLLSFGEQRYSGRCAKFAPGCGLVRRQTFMAAGMYDEWRFEIPSLESLELGERILWSGRRVLLSPDLKVTHLKRWGIFSVCSEVWHRGKVLARSLGYFRTSEAAPSEVVFTLSRTLGPAIALVGTLLLAAAFFPSPHAIAKGGAALVALALSNFSIHRFYANSRGFLFAMVSVPLHMFVQLVAAVALCTGWVLRDVFGDVSPDATVQAYAEVGVELWPPVPRRV